MEGSALELRVPSIVTRDALLRRLRLRMLVYKIVAAEEWAEAEAAGVFTGASVDRADGFIHFSTAEQAPETAAKWFAGRRDLTVAAIDAEALGEALRWEPSRGGALFPHLYATLPMSAVVWSRPLPLGRDGAHVFGSLER
jgi:uncharacterized protein (DUF952 family)